MQLIKPAWDLKSLLALKILHHTENSLVSEFTNASFSVFLTYSWHSSPPHIRSGSLPPTPLPFCTLTNVKPMVRTFPKLIAKPQISPGTWSPLPPFNQICSTLQQQIRTDSCHQPLRKASLCCNPPSNCCLALSQLRNLVWNIHFAHQLSSANSRN